MIPLPLKDRHSGVKIQKQVEEGLRSILGNCGLPTKFKDWCFQQLGLLPISWSLQVYGVSVSRVEAMEHSTDFYFRI